MADRLKLTAGEALRSTTRFLAASGSSSPRLDAELLLGRALGVERLQLYLQFERPLSVTERDRSRDLIRRRGHGEPVAYILGSKEFCGLSFKVDRSVLIPRPESEFLVELARQRLAQGDGSGRVADLGCGSGCLGISLAVGCIGAEVDLVDTSAAAAGLARENAAAHGVQGRVAVLEGDWVEPLAGRGPYRLVMSNPPYVTTAELEDLPPSVRDFEPRLALDGGADGLEAYRRLLPGLALITHPSSTVLLEGDPGRLPRVAEMCQEWWPEARVHEHQDLTARLRVLEVEVR